MKELKQAMIYIFGAIILFSLIVFIVKQQSSF
jgi:hypothetical protein